MARMGLRLTEVAQDRRSVFWGVVVRGREGFRVLRWLRRCAEAHGEGFWGDGEVKGWYGEGDGVGGAEGLWVRRGLDGVWLGEVCACGEGR